MAIENEIVITTPDEPSDSLQKQFSGIVKWSHLKASKVPSQSLIVLFEHGKFNRTQIDFLNTIKEKVKLFLFQFKKEEQNLLFNEIALHVSHKIMKRMIAFHETKIFERVISAIESESQDKLIADAYVLGNTLTVIDCAANRFDIDQKYLKSVSVNNSLSNKFEIQKDGSYLYWKEFDYHINIEGLRIKVDDVFRRQQQIKYIVENQWLGRAIKKLREASGIKQSDIKEYSERHLRRFESGESVPNYAFFETLSKYHGRSVHGYIEELSKHLD